MADIKINLPEFNNPPVIETLVGVQFQPIEKLSVPLIGYYWGKIRDEYRTCEVKPPLDPVIEEFESKIKLPKIQFSIEEAPRLRFWFVDPSQTRLIQIQNDRFIHNWRKVLGNEEYPRYENVRSTFEREWLRFARFLQEEKLETPEVNQCEVTYINHIEAEKGWKTPGEIEKVISYWSRSPSSNFLPEPEIAHISTRYLLPENRGRLYIVLEPAIRRRDAQEVLQLNLTVRGKPEASSVEGILSFFDLGHEWLVRSFADFTTEEMHKLWRKR